MKIYEAENGAFDVYFTDASGTTYTAQVTKDMLETGGENALRTSIIIILCVIAVGIGAVYVLLVPKKPKIDYTLLTLSEKGSKIDTIKIGWW